MKTLNLCALCAAAIDPRLGTALVCILLVLLLWEGRASRPVNAHACDNAPDGDYTLPDYLMLLYGLRLCRLYLLMLFYTFATRNCRSGMVRLTQGRNGKRLLVRMDGQSFFVR